MNYGLSGDYQTIRSLFREFLTITLITFLIILMIHFIVYLTVPTKKEPLISPDIQRVK